MAVLRYKTRGNASVQGKPKVYFCAAESDIKKYYDEICADIFTTHNCSVWCRTAEGEKEDIYEDIGLMNLFIVPVTTALFGAEGIKVKQETDFAHSRNIPVLPLVLESGLYELYEEIYGSMQYLDKTVRDMTAKSYAEKLKSYLDSVLIGDETAQKIRDSFGAYIFLSYRKKDREYAHRLMRLIHKNDFCEDIAIWYDEFLTPGEDFNSSIVDAMEKSQLFVLTVTPNLVNEDNYVMTTEYPMAADRGKTIFPAEMVDTDRELLVARYDGIPECVKTEDMEEFSRRMKAVVETMDRKFCDDDEHRFLMGLAYLGGVDVETDYEKAVKLITLKAEDGYIDAVRKLMNMYRNGEGVKRDYAKAMEYEEKLVRLLQERYEAENSEENRLEWLYAMSAYTDTLRECKLYDRAEVFCREFIQEAEKTEAEYQSAEYKNILAGAYNRMALVYSDMADIHNAEKYFRLFVETTQHNPEADLRDVAISNYNMGFILKDTGKLSEAKEYYLRGLSAQETVVSWGYSYDLINLAIILGGVGRVCQEQQNCAEAHSWMDKAIKTAQQAWEETKTDNDLRELSVIITRKGLLYMEEGNYIEAEKQLSKAFDISMELAQRAGTMNDERNVAVAYINAGYVKSLAGNLSEAISCYKKALDITDALAQKLHIIKLDEDKGTIFTNISDTYKSMGEYAKAAEYALRAISVAENLVKRTDMTGAMESLEAYYNAYGLIKQDMGDSVTAKEYYRKSYETAKALYERTKIVKHLLPVAIRVANIGYACWCEGQMAEAEEYYKKSEAIYDRVRSEADTPGARTNAAILYHNMGDMYRIQGRLHPAAEYMEKAYLMRSRLAEETENVNYIKAAGDSGNNLGLIWQAMGEYDKALERYTDFAETAQKLAAITENMLNRQNLATAYNNIAIIHQIKGNYRKAVEEHTKAQEAVNSALGISDAVSLRKTAGLVFHNTGDTLRLMGETAKAAEAYSKAIAYREKTAAGTKDPADIFELAISLNNCGFTLQNTDSDRAMEYYEKAIDTMESIRGRYVQTALDSNLRIFCENLVAVCDIKGKSLFGGRQYRRKAEMLREKLKKLG